MAADPRLDLDTVIRPTLARLEDSIILSLFERMQYKRNNLAYSPGGIPVSGFDGSFFDFMLYKTESVHALAGRYRHPQEHPFSKNLPEPLAYREIEESPIRPINIDFNPEIKEMYFKALDEICEKGDDSDPGSAVVSDIVALPHLSRRILFGRWVAESKFQKDPKIYRELIRNGDTDGIRRMLTSQSVEDKILERVRKKGENYNVDPQFIVDFFRDRIIPKTKDEEIAYFYGRGLD